MTALEVAEKCAQIMWKNDRASRDLGFNLVKVSPGYAEMTLLIDEKHLNGHSICHGGLIFTLADSAFAFACNTYNVSTVAHNNSITFIRPAFLRQKLTARACEVDKTGRSGIYDVSVTNDSNQVIARFRGHSRAIKGTHF